MGFPELLGVLTTRRDPRDTEMSSSEPKQAEGAAKVMGLPDVWGRGGGMEKAQNLGPASPPGGPQALGHPACTLMSEAVHAEPRKESKEALVHASKKQSVWSLA